MPEYFDVSLVARKTHNSKVDAFICLNKIGLFEGENKTEFFGGRKIIISYFEDEEADFDEIIISLPEHIFHKEMFEEELKPFTDFVNQYFQCNYNVQYALCSYELNGYHLRVIKKLQDFDADLLNKFPIIYKRIEATKPPLLFINLVAQDILI